MRKSGPVLIAIILLLAAFALLVFGVYFKTNKTNKQQITEKDKFINYSPPAGSFSVSYPKSWQTRLLGNDGVEFKNPETGSIFAIDTTVGSSDLNRESIDIVVETLKTLLKADYSSVSDTVLDGRNGKQFQFDATQPINGDGRGIVICCVNPNPKSSSKQQEFYVLLSINVGNSNDDQLMDKIRDSVKFELLNWEKLYK